MKVFISWSGDLSKEIAREFREWLPLLNKDFKPYMSDEDIEKGAQWSSHIRGELANTSFGLLILTKENVASPWLHFEAGAIVKSVDEGRVVPILFGLENYEVEQPLALFQTARFDKNDILKTIRSVNAAAGTEAAADVAIGQIFDLCWPQLHSKVQPLVARLISAQPKKSAEMEYANTLRELLTLARQQLRILSNPDDLFGREILNLLVRLTQEGEASAVRLAANERELVLALIARWKSVERSMLRNPRAEDTHEKINRFSAYVNEIHKLFMRDGDPVALSDRTKLQ